MPENYLNTLLDRRPHFLAYVARRVRDPALAEDLLQSAYMRALQNGNRPTQAEAATAWFYTVLRHAVIDFYRRRAAEAKVMDSIDIDDLAVAAIPQSSQKFVCGCVYRVLPGMKPAYAELIREVELNETSLGEFARRHDITAGNAAVRAHRARVALRRALTAFCGSCSIKSCLDCFCTSPELPRIAANRIA